MRSRTADWYRRAATRDLAGLSGRHVEWAAGVAADDELLGRLDEIAREHRAPSLLFSVAAYLGAPDAGFDRWRAWLLDHWPGVAAELRRRRTQTNEAGRCAPLVVALDRIPGPIALLEIGASAGLCLLPDRYAYRFSSRPVLGGGPVLIECAVDDEAIAPGRVPDVAWRRGIDVRPLSVADADDVRWLEALLPPDRPDRRARLRAAIGVARSDPPTIEEGDALADLERVAREAPVDATLVVASLGTLVHLPPPDRVAIPRLVAALGARFVSFEAAGVVDHPGAAVPPARFVLALDREPIAAGTPHGDRLARFE